MASLEMLDSAVQYEQMAYCVEIQVDDLLGLNRRSDRLAQIAEDKADDEEEEEVQVFTPFEPRKKFQACRVDSVGSIGSITDYKRVHIAFRNLDEYRAWVYVLLSKIPVRNYVSNDQLAKKARWTWAGIEFPWVRRLSAFL